MYVAIAYRWGDTTDHHYFLYCGPDQTKAIALAQNEASDRGGKYGCVVYEFDADGTTPKQISYFPSMVDRDDTGPSKNYRKEFLERLGIAFEQAVRHGHRDKTIKGWAPNGKKVTYVKFTPVVAPRWMHLIYARTKKYSDMIEEIFSKKP